MPNIYVTDETKKILVKAAKLEHRTLDGEINYLLQERLKELQGRFIESNDTASS